MAFFFCYCNLNPSILLKCRHSKQRNLAAKRLTHISAQLKACLSRLNVEFLIIKRSKLLPNCGISQWALYGMLICSIKRVIFSNWKCKSKLCQVMCVYVCARVWWLHVYDLISTFPLKQCHQGCTVSIVRVCTRMSVCQSRPVAQNSIPHENPSGGWALSNRPQWPSSPESLMLGLRRIH